MKSDGKTQLCERGRRVSGSHVCGVASGAPLFSTVPFIAPNRRLSHPAAGHRGKNGKVGGDGWLKKYKNGMAGLLTALSRIKPMWKFSKIMKTFFAPPLSPSYILSSIRIKIQVSLNMCCIYLSFAFWEDSWRKTSRMYKDNIIWESYFFILIRWKHNWDK